MKFTVEIHVKSSVLHDSIEQWVKSGREDNRSEGSFVFENADEFAINDGTISILKGNSRYWYNLSDLYRIKVSEAE